MKKILILCLILIAGKVGFGQSLIPKEIITAPNFAPSSSTEDPSIHVGTKYFAIKNYDYPSVSDIRTHIDSIMIDYRHITVKGKTYTVLNKSNKGSRYTYFCRTSTGGFKYFHLLTADEDYYTIVISNDEKVKGRAYKIPKPNVTGYFTGE